MRSYIFTILLFEFPKHSQFGNKSCKGRLQGSLETTNSDLLELLDDNDEYLKYGVRKSWVAYILCIYTRTHILIQKSRMSFFNVFCFIESDLVYDINKVRLNKYVFLYLVGISFLEQQIFSFYLLLKSWHFPHTRFGQNNDDMHFIK